LSQAPAGGIRTMDSSPQANRHHTMPGSPKST
jgi:hypothetical protein